nr:MAG TPA: hypothetical protein [Caudoviricetes sp.]
MCKLLDNIFETLFCPRLSFSLWFKYSKIKKPCQPLFKNFFNLFYKNRHFRKSV